MKYFLFFFYMHGALGEPNIAHISFPSYRTCFEVEKVLNDFAPPKRSAIPGMFAWCYAVPPTAEQRSAPGKRDKGGKSINGMYPIDIPIANPYKLP